jgi:hypothetical protein
VKPISTGRVPKSKCDLQVPFILPDAEYEGEECDDKEPEGDMAQDPGPLFLFIDLECHGFLLNYDNDTKNGKIRSCVSTNIQTGLINTGVS